MIQKIKTSPVHFVHWVNEFWQLLKSTFVAFSKREPFNNSIVIAYYTIFSIPGLMIILINSVGYFYSKQEITLQISNQVESVMGGDIAREIEAIVEQASKTKDSVFSTLVSLGVLLFGATGVFYQLQQMLNKIWKVKPKVKTKQKILVLIRDRFFSFGLILVVGFLLLISLVLSAALSALSGWVSVHFSESWNVIFMLLDFLISVGVITILFAAIFKFLPDVKIRWRDVWGGALLTSVLFVVAKFALGLYFGNSNPASAYGAAGSIILIMLWVSYGGLILLYGAEFTRVYIRRHRTVVKPTEIAVSTEKAVGS
jgi:membrane protein